MTTTAALNLEPSSDDSISDDQDWNEFVEEQHPETIDETITDELIDNLDETSTGDDETPPKGDEAVSEVVEPNPDDAVVEPVDESIVEPVEGDVTVTEGDDDPLIIPVPEESEVETPVPATEEQLIAQRKQYREQLKTAYQMSDEDIERFEENPQEVLPEFAANLHIQVMENVMQQVQTMLPQAFQQLTTQTSSAQQSENEFFKAWPELKGHDKTITAIAQNYRQLNPQASPEDAIKAIGMNTLYQLGVDPVKVAERMTTYGKSPKKAPAAAPTPRPHVPAGTGGARTTGLETPPEATLWSEMIDE